MKILRHASEVSAFLESNNDPSIQSLMATRMNELVADEDTPMEAVVFFIILESCDDRTDLETALGQPLMTSEGFPLWEVIESHGTAYELVFVLSSSGFGALVMAPEGSTHPEILALCQEHAWCASHGD